MNTITVPVIETEIQENLITLTISEVDRQTASYYNDDENCLICTALRNRGYNVNVVGTRGGWIEDKAWSFPETYHSEFLHADSKAKVAPFYSKEVVGKVIRLRKVE